MLGGTAYTHGGIASAARQIATTRTIGTGSRLTSASASVPVRTFRARASGIATPRTTRPHIMVAPMSTSAPRAKALTLETINPHVLDVEYAVRGELAIRADKYMHQLEEDQNKGATGQRTEDTAPKNGAGKKDLPFDKVVTANIGNPQQKGLDQKPITYWRQVISLLEYPDLMDHPLAEQIYPSDVIARARTLRSEIGSVGAYSHSKGVLAIRQRVAKFIEERDGYPSDPESIYLTAGASAGVSAIMNLALQQGDGVMIPIPQYPLYTATLAALACEPLPYNLTEPSAWSLQQSTLKETIRRAREANHRVKALVVINPGNPTGGCLSAEDMQGIVQLCHDEKILLLADEVYQNNIYDPEHKPFISFKKVLMDAPADVRESVELVSFHSISKGVSGECGRRGGYFECVNIDPKVMEQLYKMASINLCPPITGQVGVDLLVCPPKEGEASYPLYKEETTTTHEHLLERSRYMFEHFSKLPGMSCQPAEGAMYLFPKIDMPSGAIEAAEKQGKKADVMYALELLDATGICAVAGSGFGQEKDTYHLRVTALCPGVEDYVAKIEKFHKDFMQRYSS